MSNMPGGPVEGHGAGPQSGEVPPYGMPPRPTYGAPQGQGQQEYYGQGGNPAGSWGQQQGQPPQAPFQGQYGAAPQQQYGNPPQGGAPVGAFGQQPGAYGQPVGPYGAPQDGGYGSAPGYGASGAAAPWMSSYGQAGGYETAPRGMRILASIVDSLVMFIPMLLLMVVTVIILISVDPNLAGLATFLTYPLAFVMNCGYYGYGNGVRGRTWGKQLCGLRVISETTQQPIGFWPAVLRVVVWQLCGTIIVGIFSPFFDSAGRDRGWHDLAVSSRVVKDTGMYHPY
ncbi:hypothetical protein KEM60_01299 [Austwickia sp. TVS 96-490-7B]|uniref:RDD family protein n=1 Tax=Austwickia sp. TVS 96-490-7B TaxID=2830843 RepID=UPI001C5A0A35|nr:RDD family protein [Austwickia sp. TVS 96-490-7B]MBW3085106.1 hypothetical protein [Austwickia sp. TVS 96-490-7B]